MEQQKMTLYELTEQMSGIEQMLIENGGELTPELEEALTDTKESIKNKVDGYRVVINRFENSSEAIAKEIKRLQALKRVADNSVERIKRHILDVMVANDMKSLTSDLGGFTLSKSPKKLVVDETLAMSPFIGKIEALKQKLPEWMKVVVSIDAPTVKATFKDDVLPMGMHYDETGVSLRKK